MIVTQNTKLNVVPGGIIPVVHVSQYDVDREISFTLYDGNGAAVLDNGTTVSIEGTKPDGHGFSYEGTLTGNVASFATTQQMTVLVGAIECKLTLRKDSQIIGTAMFILDVEKAGLNESTVISDTDIPMIISLATEQMERAEAAAVSANTSMIASGSSALIAGNAAAICSSILPVVRGYAESAEDNAVLSGSYMRVAGESAEDAEYWAHYAEQHAGTGHVVVNENGVSMPQRAKLKFINCDITDDSTNDTTIIEAEGGGGVTIVVVPTVTNTTITYDGTQKSPTITRDTDHTYIQGDYEATNYGTYTFTIGLSGVNDIWTDNTTEPKTYTWSINYDGGTITPVNDIQTWLKCANIDDKAYTTLSEVLADHETLYALINNNNATDYLVRSTSWASGITTDETAMEYIGHKNYASDTLLGDSTWRQAICDSTYMESVLNTKVPTMTANDAPSGECFCSSGWDTGSTISTQPYVLFDGNDTYSMQLTSSNIGNVGYKFANNVKAYMAKITWNQGRFGILSIEASQDNATYNTVVPSYSAASATEIKVFETITNAIYYRLNITGKVTASNVGLLAIQFYGRTDVTENQIDIYSAASDTVYYMDNGSPVTVCTTDTTGHGTVSKSSLPNGTYTLYSTVAKDPENLSNEYSKSVTIADNTLEIYVMPDNVLYWYGYGNDWQLMTIANGWADRTYYLERTASDYTIATNNITATAKSENSLLGGVASSSQKSFSGIHCIASMTADNNMVLGLQTNANKKFDPPDNGADGFTQGSTQYASAVGTNFGAVTTFLTTPTRVGANALVYLEGTNLSVSFQYVCLVILNRTTTTSVGANIYALWIDE